MAGVVVTALGVAGAQTAWAEEPPTAAIPTAAAPTAAAAQAEDAADDTLTVQLPAGLVVQDLFAAGDHGSVTISGCDAEPGLPLILATALVDSEGKRGDAILTDFTTPGDASLPLATVPTWFSQEVLTSGHSVQFSALCSGTAASGIATLEPAAFAFTAPVGTTVESLAAGRDDGSIMLGSCLTQVQIEADFVTEVAPGIIERLPIFVDRPNPAKNGLTTIPLDQLSSWLTTVMPDARGRIELTGHCNSPQAQATFTIPPDSGLDGTPPSPETPEPTPPAPAPTPAPGDGAAPATPPGGGAAAVPAPGSTPTQTPGELAETGAPAPVPGLALGALALALGGIAVAARRRAH